MPYLLAKDTVNGAEGKVFVTRNGRNLEIAGMRNIRANAEIQTSDMRVIGTGRIQQRQNGTRQTGTGNIYYGFDVFRKMALEYMSTGHMPEFDIQIVNSDKASNSLGTQIMAFYGCSLTGTIPLAVLDSEEAMMNFDFNFTYTRAEELQGFKEPTVYGVD